MTAHEGELAAEQQQVTVRYDRLDALRARAKAALADVASWGATGTHQARSERDSLAAHYEDRLAQLNAVETGLVFGRLDRTGGERHYIGRLGLSDDEQRTLLVDWRAPAAQAFYRATPAFPADLVRRRHIRLRGRSVIGVDDDVFDLEELAEADRSTLSGEAALFAALGASRTGRMGDIVATIQAEQDAIIRADAGGVLVVQGGPGTGKTAVALHRAAYLLYTHRDRLARSGVLVVGPTPVFLRYIGQVLPSLGEAGVLLATVAELGPGVAVTGTDAAPVAALKGDLRMAEVVRAAAENRKRVPTTPVPIPSLSGNLMLTRRAAVAARNAAIHTRRPHNLARAVFVRAITDILLAGDGVDTEAAEATALRQELLETDELVEALDAMWPVLTPAELIAELYASPAALAAAAPGLSPQQRALLSRPGGSPWTAADVPLLDEAAEVLGDSRAVARAAARRRQRAAERRYAAGVLDMTGLGEQVDAELLAERFSDAGPRGSVADRAAADRSWTFGHVIVDEAQELSPMVWRMLMRRCPSRSMTVVGDIAQTSSPAGAASWAAALDPFVAGRWRVAELTVNYRTPRAVMAVAADVLAHVDPALRPPASVRVTDAVPRAVRLDPARDLAALAGVVAAEAAAVGDGKVAVLVPGRHAAAALATGLSAHLPGLATGGAPDALDARLVLLDVGQAKGLEFDAVIVVDPDAILAGSARGASDLYVALTRATQRLTVIHPGELPEMLRRLGAPQPAAPAGLRFPAPAASVGSPHRGNPGHNGGSTTTGAQMTDPDGRESDVAGDDAEVMPVGRGGEPMDTPDANSTTGPTPNESYVGRVAGQDVGYAGETGAERRAAAEGKPPM